MANLTRTLPRFRIIGGHCHQLRTDAPTSCVLVLKLGCAVWLVVVRRSVPVLSINEQFALAPGNFQMSVRGAHPPTCRTRALPHSHTSMRVKCTHGSISRIKSLHVCHASPSGDTNFGQTKFCQDVLPSLAKLSLAGTNFGQHQVWPMPSLARFRFQGRGRGRGERREGSLGVRAVQVGACPAEGGPAEKIKWLPASLPPSLPLPPPRLLGSSCLFAPLYAHALIALILLFSLCVQGSLGTPTLDELGGEPAEDCIGLVP